MVAIIGDGDALPDRDRLAEGLGALIARHGFGIVCGGLGGVMEAACRGAKAADPDVPTVAILPGTRREDANPHADVVIATGMGHARNVVVVLSADAVVAVGGCSGTLSEMAHAWHHGKPLCALATSGGWAERLAGGAIDGRRDDRIHAAESLEDVERWLTTLSPGGSTG